MMIYENLSTFYQLKCKYFFIIYKKKINSHSNSEVDLSKSHGILLFTPKFPNYT